MSRHRIRWGTYVRGQRKDRTRAGVGKAWIRSTVSQPHRWAQDLIALHVNTSELSRLHVCVTRLHWLFLGGRWPATAAPFRAAVVPVLSAAAGLSEGMSAPTRRKHWCCKTTFSCVKDHQHEGFSLITCCQAIYFFPRHALFWLLWERRPEPAGLLPSCLQKWEIQTCEWCCKGVSGVTLRNERCWAGVGRETGPQPKSEWFVRTFWWKQGMKEGGFEWNAEWRNPSSARCTLEAFKVSADGAQKDLPS